MVEKLFGTSGIRGSIQSKVTTDMALNLGRSLGTTLKGTGIVGVGTDARTSKDMLKNAFIAGMLSTGVNVIDLGFAPMPVVAAHSTFSPIKTSVIITASHNPSGDNGFKFFKNGREYIRSEEKNIERCISMEKYHVANWTSTGTVSKYDIYENYMIRAKHFLSKRGAQGRGMRVLVDLANGAAVPYTPVLLRELGFSVTTINAHPDGHFPGRPAEPSPKNLEDTMRIASTSDFSLTVCHDGDGDRLAVIDEAGNFIDQNRIIALFARDEVRRRDGGLVVVSIDTSSVIDDVIKAEGGSIIRAPLGSLQEIFSKRKEEVVFSSEPWKPIFTAFGWWMDGIVGAARITQMVQDEGEESCIQLMKSIPEYPMLREHIKCPDKCKSKFMDSIRILIEDQVTNIEQIIDVDGVRVERNDGSYVLIRVSGTEPKARVYIGAKKRETLEKLAAQARKIMETALEHAKKE
ncbi:MAG: phosphoglucosamine mutase [Candidatus Lokiarchaeota archaeon]|nr:phosphoglucosamine mutase [Candidatus Lokiarchaeota archaeon]